MCVCVCESGSSLEASRPRRKKLSFYTKLKSDTTPLGSLTRPATALAPGVSEARGTKRTSTNVLTSGSPKATKEQGFGLEIVHVYFVEVRDSVLGVFCLEFFRAKLLDE